MVSSSRKKSISPHITLFFPFLCIYNDDGDDGFTFTEYLLRAQKCEKSFTFNNVNTHLIFTKALQSHYYYFLK